MSREPGNRHELWNPSGIRFLSGSVSGGIASLNHRLITDVPRGQHLVGIRLALGFAFFPSCLCASTSFKKSAAAGSHRYEEANTPIVGDRAWRVDCLE